MVISNRKRLKTQMIFFTFGATAKAFETGSLV
jgi:hypothetical protein